MRAPAIDRTDVEAERPSILEILLIYLAVLGVIAIVWAMIFAA